MLRKIRIAAAAIVFCCLNLLLLGVAIEWTGWAAKLQLLPAVLGLNFAVVAAILVTTLLFGRIYCSVICPLGVFQDIITALRRLFGKVSKKHRLVFKGTKELRWLRYPVLILYIVAIVAGFQAAVVVLAPYSAYARMVRTAVGLTQGTAPWVLVGVAAATLVTIVVLSWTSGRLWCNAICPVGTTLGLISRFSVFKPRIDQDACIKCRRCERSCKAGAIDIKAGTFDYSRCVVCGDCMEACSEKGIHFTVAPKKKAEQDGSRRAFLSTSALVGGALIASEFNAKADDILNGGLALITPKTDPVRLTPIVPPGAGSVKSFYDRCTGCNLCVTNCPNGVLKTSTDLEHLLQPKVSYADGWCRPECNTCSTVCPAGAIKPLEKFEKLTISVGVASVDYDACLTKDGVSCNNCARHCPAGAIRMVEKDGHHIPVVNEERCLGCGACENLCPVRPLSAIKVNGREKHQNNG